MTDDSKPRLIAYLVLTLGVAGILVGTVGIRYAQDPDLVRFFDNVHWTAGLCTAPVLAWLAVRAAPPERVRGLRWIALGLTAYGIGQVVWDVQALVGYPGFPAPSDFIYLLLGPCVAVGLWIEAFRLGDRVRRRILFFDAAILGIALTTLVLVLYLLNRPAVSPLELAVLVAYPASLIATACLGLLAVPALCLKFSWSYGLFLVSLLATGVGWTLWNDLAQEGAPVDGIWLNVTFSFAALGMGAATLHWNIERLHDVRWERRYEGLLRMLPLVAVVLASLAVMWADPHDLASEVAYYTVQAGALVVIVLALFRQSMLLGEYDELQSVTRHLEASEQQQRLILNALPELVWLKDPEGVFRMCNPGFERLLGAPEREIVGKTDFDFLEPEQARFFRQKDSEAAAAGRTLQNEEWVTFADGSRVLLDTLKTPLRDRNGQLLGVLGVARDITERERTSQELALVSFALNRVKEAAYMADENGRFQYVNDEACRAMDCTREALLQLGIMDVDCELTQAEQWREFWDEIRVSKAMTLERCHRNRFGLRFPVEVNANYFEFAGQAYVLGLVRDISERKDVEEQIRSLAFFDSLTQLPNRRMLMDRLGHALIASERSGEFGALMFLDLDNFKSLNDTRGHDVGDRLLVEVARRLRAQVRQGDTVCRLGGDEFVVMLEGLGEDEAHAATHAEALAEKIRASFNEPFALGAHEAGFQGTTSIGLTLFRGQGASVELLLKQADVALYQAKDAGRNRVRFFNPAMQAAIESRMALDAALRQALERGEFQLHYQPQIDQHGALTGAEALLRWRQANRELVFPDVFIPLAEETGLILPIGRWVLDTACAQLKAWEADPSTRHLTMSVNVSARQFHQPDFVEMVRHSVVANGIQPGRLKLELTESVVLEKVEEVGRRMQELNALGVSFCLDDFGTGYSSLSYLKGLPLDQVKIDRSFVRDVTDDPNDAAIVRAILAMCHSLGLQVVAEGVETPEQREFLLENGCTAYQGFLFSRPIPIEQWGQLRDRV